MSQVLQENSQENTFITNFQQRLDGDSDNIATQIETFNEMVFKLFFKLLTYPQIQKFIVYYTTTSDSTKSSILLASLDKKFETLFNSLADPKLVGFFILFNLYFARNHIIRRL